MEPLWKILGYLTLAINRFGNLHHRAATPALGHCHDAIDSSVSKLQRECVHRVFWMHRCIGALLRSGRYRASWGRQTETQGCNYTGGVLHGLDFYHRSW